MDFYDEVPEFSLTITEGGEEGQRFVFSQSEVTLGRIADNDLVLYDPAVSRRHLVISYHNGQFIAEDLKSSNGTILNGYPLTSPTVLCEGDILEVGAVKFRFSQNVEETDDPTEVEVPVSGGFEDFDSKYLGENNQPVALHRWDAGVRAPMPPQGDTRAFPAPEFAPSTPPSAQQQAPLSPPAPVPMPATPNPFVPNTNAPSFTAAPAPQPSTLPPQPIPAPNFAHIPSPQIPPPSFQKPPAHQLQLQQRQQSKQQLFFEKRRIRHLSIWSVMLFIMALTLFIFPSKPTKTTPLILKQKPIVLDKSIYQKVFGYNQYNKNGQTQPLQVTFRFFCGNERVSLIYRIISPHSPVLVTLNGYTIAQVPPTSNVWIYQRHRLPPSKLIPFRMNTIVFRRVSNIPYRTWGLTHIALKKKTLPIYNLGRAMRYCKQAERLYHKRESLPHYRAKAIQAYLRCQDYLARKKPLPQLFKEADLMISRLESELELIFQQYLQKANMMKVKRIKLQIYKQMLSFFPYEDDPRRQRINQLIASLK